MDQGKPAEPDVRHMPPIDPAMRVRWRGMLGTLAETMGNCSGRIWSLVGTEAEVMIAHGSPLPGEGMRVAVKGSKLIYQDVARLRSTLDVASPQWSGSSEASQGIKDYLGLPIIWPDGTVFGVIEILTGEQRPFTSLHRRLAAQVRDNIQDHLSGIAGLAEKTKADAERLLEREVRMLASDTADFGAWDYEISGDELNADASWHRLLGLDDGRKITTLAGFKRLIHRDDIGGVTDASLLGLTGPHAGSTDNSLVFRIVRPDGETRWIRSASRVMDGEPRRIVGVIVDITNSQITEDALSIGHGALIEADAVLKDIRERLQLAAQATGMGIWELSEAGVLGCDANLDAILGADPGSIASPAAFLRCIHAQDRKLVDFARLAKRAQQPLHQDLQFRIVRPSGEIRWVSCATHMSEATATLPRRMRGFVTDITEARDAREALERNKVALQHTEKLVRLANWRFDQTSGQFAASDMLNEMNDSAPDAPPLTQADMEQLLSPKSQDGATNAVQHCLKTGQPYALDIRYTRLDGTSFLAKVCGRAERDSKGVIIGVVGTLQDMSEHEDTQARLATLAEALPQGATYRFEAADGYLTLIEASAGIDALIGVSRHALLADRDAFPEAVAEADRALFQTEFERSLQSGGIFDCQFRVDRANGATAWLHSRAMPRTRPDGSTVWEALLWDITQERQAKETLRQSQNAVAVKQHAQHELLATLGREIRTPMNTLIGMTRLALQTEITQRQRSYLDKVEQSAKSLQSTVGDVLDFARIEDSRMELDNTDFTLQSVLDAVSGATASRAEEKRIEIAFAIGANVPDGLRGDGLRLSQVLITLVDNAIRCTASGEVVLSIDRQPGDVPMLQFRVRDTGTAMTAEQIDGLFRPFAPAGSITSPRYSGSGLALAVSGQLVQQMGGAITVTSQPGGDTVFSFALALQRATTTIVQSPAPVFGQRRILVVDDNASARTILSDLLSGLGMSTKTASSGSEALTALHHASEQGKPVDLMLADWRMPGMDGLELARRIRTDQHNSIPALLMVTAFGRDEVVRRVEELGLSGLLIKPVTQASMVDAMQAMFAPGAAAVVATQPSPGVDRAAEDAMALLADRRILVVDDDALELQTTTDMLEQAGMSVDTAASGGEALERLGRRSYDAVLMDTQMRSMDGREATRRIRRNPAWARLPIIGLTAPGGSKDRDSGPGMTTHLAKPLDEAELYRTLVDIFTGTTPVEAIVPPDFEAALRRQNGDPERLGRLLRGFMRDFADIPAKLGNLIGTDDMPETAALAHLVKGAASYLEARQLTAIAGELEQAARDSSGDIDAIAREFRRHLLAVLDAVGTKVAENMPPVAYPVTDRAAALALIARVRPLAARGDHAATTALKQLASLIESQSEIR